MEGTLRPLIQAGERASGPTLVLGGTYPILAYSGSDSEFGVESAI